MPFTEGLLCNNGRAAILSLIFANCTLTTPMQGGSYAAQAFRDCRGPDAGAFVWRRFRAGTRRCRGAHAGRCLGCHRYRQRSLHPAVFLGRAEVGPGRFVCQRDSRDEVLYQVREPWQLQPGLFVWRRLQRAGLLPVRPSLVAHPVYEAGLQLQPRKILHAQGCD